MGNWGGNLTNIPGILRRYSARRPSVDGLRVFSLLWLILLLPFAALQDTQPDRMNRAYAEIVSTFHHGLLRDAQREAEVAEWAFSRADAVWFARFLTLHAEIAQRRGRFHEALQLIRQARLATTDPEEELHSLVTEARAQVSIHDFNRAEQSIQTASNLCSRLPSVQCGYLSNAKATLFILRGKYDEAWLEAMNAFRTGQRFQNADLLNYSASTLGWTARNRGDYEIAQDWDRRAIQIARESGDRDQRLIGEMNLADASLVMGDSDQAIELSEDAAREAERLGDPRTELAILHNKERAESSQWQMQKAEETAQRIIPMARALDDKRQVMDNLLTLAGIQLWQNKQSEAARTLSEIRAILSGSDAGFAGWRTALTIQESELLHGQGRDREAEDKLRALSFDNLPFTQLCAAYRTLASILQGQGKLAESEAVYREGIEQLRLHLRQNPSLSAQIQMKYSSSLLFSDAIQFLVQQGRSTEALQIVDFFFSAPGKSESTGLQAKGNLLGISDPRATARRTQSAILTYWLGYQASYLWVVTPQAIRAFALPNEHVLKPKLRDYRKAIIDGRENDPAVRTEGRELWQTLVGPAVTFLPKDGQVIVIDDEDLSKLNFETLLAPNANDPQNSHYWIEDVTLRVAPSLAALAATQRESLYSGRMLLMGDAQQASPEYPPLPLATLEMQMVGKHFATQQATVLTQEAATPAAYERSNPGQYAYLHFVSHGVASSADPMDSFLVLSRASSEEDSYRLYARAILDHPLRARLVTISACQASGARYFTGQGMVGLVWAFQRAGAHNVIGSLWEVSDESTPRLMDTLYDGLQRGLSPAQALRQGKLALLHGASRFSPPAYWATFQFYATE
jgi:CHAT domain-containing protein